VALAAAPGATAVDPAAFPPLLAGAVDAGTLGDLAPGTVALDRAQAATWGVGVGRVLDLGGGDERPVVAVYRSSGVLGPVTVHPADAAGAPVRQVLVAPDAGTDAVALRDAVARAVGQDPSALVLAPAALRDELAGAVRLVRAAALGLLAVTVLVAVVGVAVSLVLSVRERRAESAVLRRLGLTPGQVVAAVGLENALLGLAAALVGTGLGGLFGVLAVFALREAAVVPVDQVALGAAALVLVAALAGTLPAVRPAREA
jgi:putative ABC transport system permease protein